ncbi:MAG: cytochrome C oxidase subunit IV family protein [Isosphaeraceae bacterium]|nr:cytochrome C oxidase subunit IV family protein [Isosphaeraceae bacterium]
MADSHAAAAHDDHGHGSDHIKIYMRVFVSLAVLTAIEYFYAALFQNAFTALVLGLLTWALIKAALVGLYFMHVKWEGKWIYAMLAPACFLAVFMVCMLIPDIVIRENDSALAAAEAAAEEEEGDDETIHPIATPAAGMPAATGAPAAH